MGSSGKSEEKEAKKADGEEPATESAEKPKKKDSELGAAASFFMKLANKNK